MSQRPAARLNNAMKEVRRQMRKLQNKQEVKSKKEEIHEVDEDCEIEQVAFKATGSIMVSGTTVHGTDTKFLTELKQNDEVIIRHNETEERRKVILVLSDKSACIAAAFPEEVTSEFFIQKPNVKVIKEDEGAPEKKMKVENEGKMYDVRVKRGPWTYKVDKVSTKDALTHEDLLNIRTQRVRDKFCFM